MADIAVTQAAFAGFGLLRRKPWAPLVWSTLYAGVLGGLVVLLGGAFILAVGRLATLQQGKPPPLSEVFSLLGGLVGGYFLFLAVFWVLSSVIGMAVVRAVLEPESAAFAYMRLGVRELWLMLANFVLYVLYLLVSIACSVPIALLTLAVASTSPNAAAFVRWPIQLVTWGVTLWLGLRFCMVAPMIFTERRFRLFESWTFTRGHVWRLFQVGLLVVLATLGIYVVLAIAAFAAGAPLVQQLAASASPQTFFTKTPAEAFRALSPLLILYVALVWISSTLLLPLFFAPWPAAYRQLSGDELAATFS
jgi:hypothetical protein